jgi:hypothetical protein
MSTRKAQISLLEVALSDYTGRLVTTRSEIWVKVTGGTMSPPVAADYIRWAPGEQAVFMGVHRSGKSPAGRARGWGKVLLHGKLGFIQPSKLGRLVLEADDEEPTV